MKAHFILRLALLAIVAFVSNVASACRSHDPTGIGFVADDVSTIEAPSLEPTQSFVFIKHDLVAAEALVFRQPDESYVDRYLLNLPDHNLLPTRTIWLLGHSIRLC